VRDGLLHEGHVQTFRARERATGRIFEAHFAASLDLLAGVDAVIDRGSHEGRLYVVASPAAQPAALDSAGAWRVKPSAAPPSAPPAPSAQPAPPEPGAAPGDFTRMFQLRQAPEPVAVPVPSPAPAPAAASQPGEFTRAFQRPAAAPSAAPMDSPAPGQPGEFTRMFQKPVAAAPSPAPPPVSPPVSGTPDDSVPAPPPAVSQRWGAVIAIAAVLLSAIVVFLLMRRLY
jgi:hypothetical protein